MMQNALKIISGTSNLPLAQRISQYCGVPLTDCEVRRFADGEIKVQINQNIRGSDLFIIQPTNPPAENLFELLIMIDAARRASAKRITAVMPYYGYARQDRKDQPRVPITAKLVANLITVAGADRIITMDLHAAQLQGYFDIPHDHFMRARPSTTISATSTSLIWWRSRPMSAPSRWRVRLPKNSNARWRSLTNAGNR